MESDFETKQNYVPDEGEIYLEEQYQGKSGKRNTALLVFLTVAVPVVFIMLAWYVIETWFF